MKPTRLAALAAALTSTALALSGFVATSAANAAEPGVAGPSIRLGTSLTTFGGADIATDQATGTAYAGWISSGDADAARTVHLCVLPPGATACQGGILSTAAQDASTADSLHVVVTGPGAVTMVYFHETGTTSGHLGYVTYNGGAALSPSQDATVAAPNEGSLDDVQVGPDGQIWALTEDAASITANVLTLRDGLGGSPTAIPVSFPVGHAQLAFSGTQPIVTIGKAGSISDPVSVASGPGFAVSDVAGTWTVGSAFDEVTTSSGARMLASEPNAGYRPQSLVWNGSSYVSPTLTGDNTTCPTLERDSVTDASGRIADVAIECSDIAISNLTDTQNAAVVRFASGGTPAGPDPQIGTFANGTGWVMWGIENGGTGDTLQVAPIRLPGRQVTVSATKSKNVVTVTGPASCLPVVSIGDAVTAKAAKHWKLKSTSLTLDGHSVATTGSVDGSVLTPGSTHTLVGTAVFKKTKKKHHHHHHHHGRDARASAGGGGGHHHHHKHKTKKKTVTVTLTFRGC